jgi:predicted metalloenzyme YecM
MPVDKKSGSWTFHMNLVLPSSALLKFPINEANALNEAKALNENTVEVLISSSSAAPGSLLVVELPLPLH